MNPESAAPPDEPRPRSPALRWGMQIVLVVGVYLSCSSWQSRNLIPGQTPAPDFTLGTLDGKAVALSDLRGQRVLVHFWATWCGVCRREFGTLNAVNDGLSDGEKLLTIVADSAELERIRSFVRENDIRYPVLLGTDEVIEKFRVRAFPTNYFVDETGRVQSSTVGMSTRWGLATRLGCAGP